MKSKKKCSVFTVFCHKNPGLDPDPKSGSDKLLKFVLEVKCETSESETLQRKRFFPDMVPLYCDSLVLILI